MRIDHINIAAPMGLLTEVRNFYCDILGLEEGPRPHCDFGGYWLYGDGRPIVELMDSDSHYRAERPHHIDHIAFRMEKLTTYIRNLEARGIEYQVNYLPELNTSRVFCKDPCGNGITATFPGEKL